MSRIIIIYLVIGSGLQLVNCNREPIIIVQENCKDFEYGIDDCWIGAGPLYAYGGLQFKAPYFNPNNQNEFAFIEVNYNVNAYFSDLNIYNISTLEKKYVTNDISVLNQPKWNTDNKLLFNKNNQIFVIKTSGDSLTQLTFSGLNIRPEWVDLSNICYMDNYNSEGVVMNIFTLDKYIVENNVLTNSDVSSNSMIAATDGGVNNPNIAISPVDSFNWEVVTNNTFDSERDRIMCIQWHPNNEDIYYTKWNTGLFKVNINTKKEECILEGCQSKWYHYFSISPDGQKIIAERVDATFDNQGGICYLYSYSSIVLMNIDGTNEITILPKP